MKTFKFHNATITIEITHMYGRYVLRGLNTSVLCEDSTIWDYCDDDENPEKMREARRRAYWMLRYNRY